MRNFLLSISFLGGFVFSSCSNATKQPDMSGSSKAVNIDIAQLALTTDPVCNMSLENHKIADTATVQNKLYGFCAEGCKEAFVKDPDKYLAAR